MHSFLSKKKGFSKTRLSRPTASDLHAQDHQLGTAMLASQLRGESFLSVARHAPRTSRPWLQNPAERRHHRERGQTMVVSTANWDPPHSGSPSTTISRRRPSMHMGAQIHVTHRFPLLSRHGRQHSPGPNHDDPKPLHLGHVARWWPRTSRGRPHLQERACRGKREAQTAQEKKSERLRVNAGFPPHHEVSRQPQLPMKAPRNQFQQGCRCN